MAMTEKGDGGVRLFVGVPLSIEVTESIAAAVEPMKAAAEAAGLRARWVAPVNYHVTVKFLGWTRVGSIPPVRDAIGAAVAGVRGGDLQVVATGAFPSEGRGRVLWMGVDDRGGGLARLARGIDDALADLGFDRERRPFHPHVTVGRLREVADVRPVVLAGAEQKHSPSRVESIVLYESQMKSAGSEYVVQARWPL